MDTLTLPVIGMSSDFSSVHRTVLNSLNTPPSLKKIVSWSSNLDFSPYFYGKCYDPSVYGRNPSSMVSPKHVYY